LLWIAEELACG